MLRLDVGTAGLLVGKHQVVLGDDDGDFVGRPISSVFRSVCRHAKLPCPPANMPSYAGMRNKYQTIYDDFVEPRRPFAGLVQAQRDFETHRKALKVLLDKMQSAQTSAACLSGEKKFRASRCWFRRNSYSTP